jgi:uncharacterized membrane protein YcaP (DUF421 family)
VHLIASAFDEIIRFQIPVWDKVLRTIAVYALVYVLIRLARRDAAQLTASDFVVLLLLSNVVQNAVIGPDDSLMGGVVGAVTLIVINEFVVRWDWARSNRDRSGRGVVAMTKSVFRTAHQDPVYLIEDGELQRDALRGLGIRDRDLIVELRRQGVDDPSNDVRQASLHTGGAIDFELKERARTATEADVAELKAELRGLREAVERIAASGGGR